MVYNRKIAIPILEHARQFSAYCIRRRWGFAYHFERDLHIFTINAGIRDQELPSGIWRPA